MRKRQENWVSGNSFLNHRLFLLGLFFLTSLLIFSYIIGELNFDCPFNSFFNFKCLTCGSTTAFRYLINGGDFFSVFKLNPLFYFWVIVFALSYFDFMMFTVFNFKSNLLYKLIIKIERNLFIRYSCYLVFILNLIFLNLMR